MSRKYHRKYYCSIIVMTIAAMILVVPANGDDPKGPVSIIFDTDLSSDVDDVGALAVLHALSDRGDVHILATMVSSGDPWSAACLDALNTYFGRPNIPIGVVAGPSVVHISTYTRVIAEEFPHNITPDNPAEDAVVLYRKLLAAAEDRSVVIVTVGYLTNLHRLVSSVPDTFSDADGHHLIRRKVRKTICMGGQYPSGREWNFFQDASSTRSVVEKWPGPMIFVGFESGRNVLTGARLASLGLNNPLKRSYELYNGLRNRPSWDQVTVLYAATHSPESYNGHWSHVIGRNRVHADGSNQWEANPHGPHAYVQSTQELTSLAETIEDLMVAACGIDQK